MCEEGGNWNVNGSVFAGGLGMSHANWNQFNTFGFPSNAAYASPLQQIRVAVAFATYYYGNPNWAPDQNGCSRRVLSRTRAVRWDGALRAPSQVPQGVDSPGQRQVEFGDPPDVVGHQRQAHRPPPDVDVRVVVGLLGQRLPRPPRSRGRRGSWRTRPP